MDSSDAQMDVSPETQQPPPPPPAASASSSATASIPSSSSTRPQPTRLTAHESTPQHPHQDAPAADAYEATHVHAVYEAIAPHFSATRHKPWPMVTTYLAAQPAGSVGLDIGCGNGKYIPVNPSLHFLASDRSASLVGLARNAHHASFSSAHFVVADGLALPYRPSSADFAICIAVIHHLSTPLRRREAIAAMLECLRDGVGATALIYVWALEQSNSRRGWDEGSAQDTLVPWVMRAKGEADTTFQRYYHLFRKGELDDDVRAAGGVVLESGYEKDNWWVICGKQPTTTRT